MNSALPRAPILATASSTALDQSPPAKASLPLRFQHHAGMAEDRKAPKIRIVCGTCGSDHVSRDAWADWDTNAQEWVLGAVFDYGHCHDCDGESRLAEVPL